MGKKAKERKRREREAQTSLVAAVEPSTSVDGGTTSEQAGSISGGSEQGSAADTKASTDPELSGQLATRLNSVAIHLLRRLQREDTKLGLSGARLSALSVLVFGGPRTLGKLADAEGVSPPSMTRLVTAMEAEGLVAREKNSADGRSVIVRASAEGERILIRGREQRVEALAGWLAELSPAGLASLDDATTTLESLLRSERTERMEALKPDQRT
jgi:DNA-binding MarR family transcriptional regulator